jgi:DNA polymerase elongation subunit (family B)
MYAQRSEFKKQALMHKQEKENTKDPVKIKELEKLITRADCQQMAIKILMNSLYGAMSNEHFRYFDVRIAESITVSGQLSIRWAERAINSYLNKLLKTDKDYVIAIDTDSLYINFEPLVEKMYKDAAVEDIVKILDQICVEKIEPLVASNYEALRKLMNAPQQKMVMKREVIADKGIWTGKKHYILNVHNSEGVQYAKPKLKIVGIEAVRSSTPGVCRKMIVDTLNVIMQSDEKTVQDYIAELRKQFDTYGVEDIAFPRGVSNMDKYADKRSVYVKATPINCRAALVYNHLLNQMNLASKYEPINTGEKIKFVYLKTPNTIGENVIGFPVVLPQELNVHKYVDYELQWQKAFLEPLRTILDAAGWQVEKTSTLEDFFS